MEVQDTIKCDDCGSRNLTKDATRGEVVCEDCGLVLLDQEVDLGPDWRSFEGDDRARTGAAHECHDARQRTFYGT